MRYKSLLATVIIAFMGFASPAVDLPAADLKDLVCTSRWFSVPESFDTKNVEQCKLLVRANPERFEPHAMLAVALMTNKEFDAALEEFRLADKYSADVTDREALASVPYEDLYASTLLAGAVKRCAADGGDLYALRMLQQALGMGKSHLQKQKQLHQCYTMMSHIYLRRGLYGNAIEAATFAIEAAKVEGKPELIPTLEKGLEKARELQSQRSRK
jgi:tetratricopeptide (TPR) repeat protein